jgi:hypothetical protein
VSSKKASKFSSFGRREYPADVGPSMIDPSSTWASSIDLAAQFQKPPVTQAGTMDGPSGWSLEARFQNLVFQVCVATPFRINRLLGYPLSANTENGGRVFCWDHFMGGKDSLARCGVESHDFPWPSCSAKSVQPPPPPIRGPADTDCKKLFDQWILAKWRATRVAGLWHQVRIASHHVPGRRAA